MAIDGADFSKVRAVVPQTDDKQITAVLSVIAREPQEDWSLFVSMLGLDGAEVLVSKGRYTDGMKTKPGRPRVRKKATT